MKLLVLPFFVISLVLGSGLVWAEEMKDHAMKDMPMDAKPAVQTHHAVGTVKSADPDKGIVTISHGAVKSLNWPAMTMTFGVKDKALLKPLAVGKKVEVDFVEQGPDYTIVKVK
jgi:Cu(I)/Ag(I) efflux system protein CusF